MTVKIIIKKINRNLNDFGMREAFLKSIAFVLKKIYVQRIYRIYRRDLRTMNWSQLSPGGIEFKIVDLEDIKIIKQIEDMEEWLHSILSEILSHGLCIAALDGPQVVGFNLVAFNEVYISLLNLKKHLRPHEAWSEQITVLKAYRKQGLASALRYRVFSELQKRDIQFFYGGALISNIPSLKNAEKVGFNLITDVRYLKVLNCEDRSYRRIKNANY